MNTVTHTKDEHDALVRRLRDWGLRFLAPSQADSLGLVSLSPSQVIARLAGHSDARLRLALVPLLILHPNLASEVQSVVQQLTGPAQIELQALYTAAVYLQRLWHTRLGLYLGEFEALPDLYSAVLGLPRASEHHGKTGLHALAEWHAHRSPHPFNRLASYNKMVGLLFEQLKREAKCREPATSR